MAWMVDATVLCKSPAMNLSLCNSSHYQLRLFFCLSSIAEFSEVESDFHAKVPAVFCRDVSK